MSGGTWVTQNKIRPGVYINFKGEPVNNVTVGSRGTVAIIDTLSWGPETIVEVTAQELQSNPQKYLGVDFSNADLYEYFTATQYASKFLIRRVNGSGSIKAKFENTVFKAEAIYSGIKGNNIAIELVASIDAPSSFNFNTYFNDVLVDTQLIASPSNFVANNYIAVTALTGSLTNVAKTALTGGTDVAPLVADITAALTEFETKKFDVMATTINSQDVKALVTAYTIRQFEEEGKYFQTVLYDFSTADTEHVVSVKNGLSNSANGYSQTNRTTIMYAAMSAASEIYQSLTYTTVKGYDGVTPALNNSATEQALVDGNIVFTMTEFGVVIEQDKNTLKTLMPNKNKAFQKNRVVKTLAAITRDLKGTFERNYIGKVDANRDGLELFKTAVISYLEDLQSLNAIQNFDSRNDVLVTFGDELDAIIVTIWIQPVDSVEKIYMSVEVR